MHPNDDYAESTRGAAGRRGWLREPVLHFLLIGALLVLASWLWAPREADSDIVIDEPRVERLAQLYALQTGSPPTPAERARLIEDYIRDEAMYREARWLRLDEGDELVRRRLVQKMDFLIASSEEAAAPSEEQLRRFHREHAAQFTAPARVTLLQVFFSPDTRGNEGAREAAALMLAQHGESNPAVPAADRPPLPSRIDNATLEELKLAFGDRPMLQALMDAPVGRWLGPLESGYGWHLLRVIERTPAATWSFEQARADVEAAWLRQARARAAEERVAQLMKKYRVVYTGQAQSTPAEKSIERTDP